MRLLKEGVKDRDVAAACAVSRSAVLDYRKKLNLYVARKWLPLQERLMSLSKVTEAGCWEWIGTKQGSGYGYYPSRHKGERLAHRVSYEAFIGPVPADLVLHHKCHNTLCINPDHLEPMTTGDHKREHSRMRKAS